MKKVVVIGGGTGSFNILSGLKEYPISITSVISMMDSGGSSGILRDEFGVLPPGDVRRALVALSDSDLMRKLFEHRFDKGNGLKGHNFGNLILTALNDLFGGDAEAIEKASEILRIKGKVLPVTIDNAHLCAELTNGENIFGESKIGNEKVKHVFLNKKAKIYSKTKKAIKEADLIILGPGDLYTSILPNLLVNGVAKTVRNSKAKTVFVCNIMTKGETKNFTAKDYVNEIKKYLGVTPDIVVMNNAKPPFEMLEKYAIENSYFVEPNHSGIKTNLLKIGDFARHDPKKLAKTIYRIISK